MKSSIKLQQWQIQRILYKRHAQKRWEKNPMNDRCKY
jgi:hypothetical protein